MIRTKMLKYNEFINEDINFKSLTTKDLEFKINKEYSINTECIDVYIDNLKAAHFGVSGVGDVYDIATHGNVDVSKRVEWWRPDDVKNILNNRDQFKDSIYLSGGFWVNEEYRGKGLGKLIIKKVFEDFPKYKSIFLYSMTPKAKLFWIKTMKGIPILGHKDTDPFVGNGVYLIRLDRDKII